MNASDQPYTLPADRNYLLVFDIHQNIRWLQRVLDAESGNYDHLILGGDYFDPYEPYPHTATDAETAAFYNVLLDSHRDRLTILLGNHDLPYLVAQRMADPGFFYHPFSDLKGYDTLVAKDLARQVDKEFWDSGQLFATAHGYLISHAGVAEEFWPLRQSSGQDATESIESSLSQLWTTCRKALAEAKTRRHPILEPGRARGGDKQERGGIIWQDWNLEFSDEEIPLPQIVGHTRSASGARQKGRSWCLDGQQTCYGILWPDGALEVKTI
jgi:hypothetical protein